jgi:predicted transcriptional regulator
MSTDNFSDDDSTENFKIFATDDKKIKSFGEIFTNDSSREILQLLFNEELSATQIAQKSNISLQLVKYHLNKLQDLSVVKISKIEKNSKSQATETGASLFFVVSAGFMTTWRILVQVPYCNFKHVLLSPSGSQSYFSALP